LTLILKGAFSGALDLLENPISVARMFVNISPTKFDTAVTNRSMKFAQKTGRIKTNIIYKNASKILE
jgi:hypothetical protein